MNTIRSITLFVLLFSIAGIQPAEAQFRGLRKKLQEKATQKVERTVEQRVEARIDRAMDNAINKSVDAAANNLESSIQGLLFSGEPANVEVGENETGDADAPFVTYTTVSRVKLLGGAGPAGALLNRFGATKEITYVHGAFQRVDDEKSSQIMDAEAKRIVGIDEENKTFWIMGVDEFVEPMRQLAERGMPSMDVPGTQMAEQQMQELKVTVDRREGTRTINGVPARRTVVVVEGDYTMSGVDQESGESMTIQGKSYTVLDQWHSSELAGYNTIRGFEKKMAEALMSAFDRETLNDFASAMGRSAPGMQQGMAEAFKELGDVEGIVVRSEIHFVQVPPEGTFNLEAVLEDGATRTTAMDPTTPRSMYTFMTEIGDLTAEPVDLAVFSPPSEGYTQVESPMKKAMEMMGGGQ